MTYTTTTPKAIVDAEIARQVELARKVHAITKSDRTPAVTKLWHSKRRFTLGFFFPKTAVVGQRFDEDHGVWQEVVAIVK